MTSSEKFRKSDNKEKNPYKILGLSRSATKEEIKKAYTKLVLRYHPDRKTGDIKKYEEIREAYKEISEERTKLTLDDILKFEEEYKNSEEEIKDIIRLYKIYKGDVSMIIDNLLLAVEEDELRIRAIIEEKIKSRELRRYKLFDKKRDKKRERRMRREAKEAEKLAKELGIDLSRSLEEQIKENAKKREFQLEEMEKKYCKK
ncbi:DnaJ like protein subfamily C member 9 [Astathelohania contejeani]|uniref:DnaJ like protein subfamily C member 9 n=1 Tax=Astathelohania contejeani TaxID=164912 RepID=A0ABQ7I1P3_9MICR|nr:DnaJ like protein subfamily C member 9 [Thelohania contejeani]